MYRHAVAVVTATSAAALLATAAPAIADDTTSEPAVQCSREVFSVNVAPPPPLAGTVTAEDIRGLMDTLAAGARLPGFFSGGAGAPAGSAVPYVAPYAMPWEVWPAVPYDARLALPGPARQVVPDQPLSAATIQPGADGASPGQPGIGVSPSQPGYGGPSPSLSASPNPSPSAAPSSSLSASATPSASASAAPSLTLSPLNAGEASVPVQVMFDDPKDRVLVCARSTSVTGTEVPPMPDMDAADIGQDLETFVVNLPAACVTTDPPSIVSSTSSSVGPAFADAASPAESPATLLEAIGVSQVLSTLTNYPELCAGKVPTDETPTSLLDSIGVTSLFKSLTG
ncbi:hypothetical protein ACWDA3_16495 [Nonomuraea rubra]